eukprot:5962163-Lingulodinium_polyedra.AAC.1
MASLQHDGPGARPPAGAPADASSPDVHPLARGELHVAVMLSGGRRSHPIANDSLHGQFPRPRPDALCPLKLAGRGVDYHGIKVELLQRDEVSLVVAEEL